MHKRKYRIFDTCWHIAHQSDMIYALQDDCEFYFGLNSLKQWSEQDMRSRSIPKDIHFVTHYERGKYDVAILHVDQQVVSSGMRKRRIYDEFNRLIKDIPKIVINHGTPVYPEGIQKPGLSEPEIQQECVSIMKDIIGENVMVVNSFTASSEKEWGFGIPIVHGMHPNKWLDLDKEPRIFTALSPYGLDAYYNRKCMFKVAEILYNTYGYTLWYAKLNIDTQTSFEKYQDFLGRSLLYLDTSYRTPMNRARTEAFLSGCCVIQVEGAHDLERWAKDEQNIILVPNNPKKIAARVVDFIENRYSEAVTIGQCGKEMATEEFSVANYRENWLRLLRKVTNT